MDLGGAGGASCLPPPDKILTNFGQFFRDFFQFFQDFVQFFQFFQDFSNFFKIFFQFFQDMHKNIRKTINFRRGLRPRRSFFPIFSSAPPPHKKFLDPPLHENSSLPLLWIQPTCKVFKDMNLSKNTVD